MKKLTLIIPLLLISLSIYSAEYNPSLRVDFNSVFIQNLSLNYENDIRNTLNIEARVSPLSLKLNKNELSIFSSLGITGSSDIINYTRVLGYYSLSLGLGYEHYFSNRYSFNISLSAGIRELHYILKKDLFLQADLSNIFYLTTSFYSSFILKVIYLKESICYSLGFSLGVKPLNKELED